MYRQRGRDPSLEREDRRPYRYDDYDDYQPEYREAPRRNGHRDDYYAEGRPDGRLEGRPDGRPEGRPDGRPEGRPDGRSSRSDRMGYSNYRNNGYAPHEDRYEYDEPPHHSASFVKEMSSDKPEEFTSLCVYRLPDSFEDDYIRDFIHRSYRRFGQLTVNVTMHNEGQDRVAYLNFRSMDDAVSALEGRSSVVLSGFNIVPQPVVQRNRQNSRAPPGPGAGPGAVPRASNRLWKGNMHHDNRPDTERVKAAPNFSSKAEDRRSFPHHMDHRPPEDDELATRTLFVGNLDSTVTPDHLRSEFEDFGVIVDVDVKRPTNTDSNGYAFVQFFNLDMAHKAKAARAGTYIKKFQCKLGYGRAKESLCLWVGSLEPDNVTRESLEQEFDRFGAISKIFWPEKKSYAYILYDSIDAAKAACQDMRGYCFGSSKIRIDFVNPADIDMHDEVLRRFKEGKPYRPSSVSVETNVERRSSGAVKRPSPVVAAGADAKKPRVELPCESAVVLQQAKSTSELMSKLSSLWRGALILKSSAFPVQLFHLAGNSDLVRLLDVDSKGGVSLLKITQRLRLDQTKLGEVERRISGAGHDNWLLVLVGAAPDPTLPPSLQYRPLQNLIGYLNKKDAAGVISLSNEKQQTGIPAVAHAFPPCPFAAEHINNYLPKLDKNSSQGEHMVLVVLKGIA